MRYTCAEPEQEKYVQEDVISQCDCPRQCNNTYYSSQMSSSPASLLALESLIATLDYDGKQNISSQMVTQNYAMVDIYLAELSYEEIVTIKAYNILSLVSDIGGTLGLLLGATVVTLFEILDFFVITGMEMIGLKKYKSKVKTALATAQLSENTVNNGYPKM